jgi:hypothetical protein
MSLSVPSSPATRTAGVGQGQLELSPVRTWGKDGRRQAGGEPTRVTGDPGHKMTWVNRDGTENPGIRPQPHSGVTREWSQDSPCGSS